MTLLKIILFPLLLPLLLSICTSQSQGAKPQKFSSTESEGSLVDDPSKYIQDPYVFLRWPGFYQTSVATNYPWFHSPWLLVRELEKKKPVPVPNDEEIEDKEKVQDDEDEEEDDEPEDDFDLEGLFHKDKYHYHEEDLHYKPWKKQKPTAVSSVGFGPAVGKATWYGVLRPNVNSRSDLIQDEELEEEEDDDGESLEVVESHLNQRPNEFYYVPHIYRV